MKIAIAAVLYDDTSRIGSQRARALSRELAARGNRITVLTAGDPQDKSTPFPEVEVIRLGPYGDRLWPTDGCHALIQKTLAGLVVAPTVVPLALLRRRNDDLSGERIAELTDRRASSVLRLNQLLSTHVWIRNAREQLTKHKSSEPFDVVFSTFDPLGRVLREDGRAKKWVADFRDAAVLPNSLPAIRHYLRRYQDRILRDADGITAVSAGVRRALISTTTGRRVSTRISVVTNGFTPRKSVPPAPNDPSAPLRIVYTGALYDRRVGEIGRLLRTAAALHASGKHIEVVYAGRDGANFREAAERAGAADLIQDLGLLSYDDSIALQESADILLVVSWNSPEEQGVLSGKFLEYLSAQRPILVMVAGTQSESELSALVEKMNVGLCCEEARGETDETRLRDWLTEACDTRSRGLPLAFSPSHEEVRKFDYRNIARRLENIFTDLFA